MHSIALAGLLSALFATPGLAQVGVTSPGFVPGSDAPIVTEAEFLSTLNSEEGDAVHPAIAESSEALAIARARIVAAETLDNPMLGIVREDPDSPVEQMEWTLSWQLPGADRRPHIAAREEAAAAAAARLSQQLLSLRLEMKGIYADWAVASARHDCLLAQAERVAALADREKTRAQRGETSGLDAHRLELAASGLRTRVALAAASALEARARAANWFPALPSDARPVLPALPAVPGLREDHPLVRAAEKDLAAATFERQAAGRFVRSPEVVLGWQRQEAARASIDGPILGLAWSVPMFSRNRAEKAVAEARISGARARLESARWKVQSARSGAQASFQHLVMALEDAEDALRGNQRLLDGTEAAFRYGEASLTDLLETHRSVTESELAVLDLQEAALAAYRELERLAGYVTSANDPSKRHFESNP